MKKLSLCLLLLSASSFANDGLTIPNSFQVDKQGHIFRGKEPKKLVNELYARGITDVLIFKNEVKNEVALEVSELTKFGITAYQIPFSWKGFTSMELACGQVIDALDLITKTKQKNRTIYFHCTAGEDRTGMLAGLYRMLEERLSMAQVFSTEMCARGYSDGNPNKPPMVYTAIQRELTPLFVAMAQKIEKGEWSLGRLNKQGCKTLMVAPSALKCRN